MIYDKDAKIYYYKYLQNLSNKCITILRSSIQNSSLKLNLLWIYFNLFSLQRFEDSKISEALIEKIILYNEKEILHDENFTYSPLIYNLAIYYLRKKEIFNAFIPLNRIIKPFIEYMTNLQSNITYNINNLDSNEQYSVFKNDQCLIGAISLLRNLYKAYSKRKKIFSKNEKLLLKCHRFLIHLNLEYLTLK